MVGVLVGCSVWWVRAMAGIAKHLRKWAKHKFGQSRCVQWSKIVTYDLEMLSLDTRALRSRVYGSQFRLMRAGVPLSKNIISVLRSVLNLYQSQLLYLPKQKFLPDSNTIFVSGWQLELCRRPQWYQQAGTGWGSKIVPVSGASQREIATIASLIDSVLTYKSNFHKRLHTISFNTGLQYDVKLSKTSVLRFGVPGVAGRRLGARRRLIGKLWKCQRQ